jgi:hypothetical protein
VERENILSKLEPNVDLVFKGFSSLFFLLKIPMTRVYAG